MRRSLTTSIAVLALTASLVGCSDDTESANQSANSNTGTTLPTASTQPNSNTASGSNGGGSNETPAGVKLNGAVNTHGTTTAAGTEIAMKVADNYFEPTFVKVEPGKKYTVKLDNIGKRFHTFTASSLGADVSLNAGEKKTVEITAPASGSVEFVCTPHAGMGMRGAIYTS